MKTNALATRTRSASCVSLAASRARLARVLRSGAVLLAWLALVGCAGSSSERSSQQLSSNGGGNDRAVDVSQDGGTSDSADSSEAAVNAPKSCAADGSDRLAVGVFDHSYGSDDNLSDDVFILTSDCRLCWSVSGDGDLTSDGMTWSSVWKDPGRTIDVSMSEKGKVFAHYTLELDQHADRDALFKNEGDGGEGPLYWRIQVPVDRCDGIPGSPAGNRDAGARD